MDEIKAKQLVVEKIKESTKILVTVSNDPSVDALSAALALTLLLDKQQKYATAIFSGETPPAIAFLEPEKTFDDTTDSLRDFIIALNKEKADHLRYKVEGDAVKIFITPYKTTISEKDLEFSQGDYNVELVIALGVNNQGHLDNALANHGQILHDASIVTMTAGDQMSDLGGTDWHDSNSSSLSEMVAGLAEALKDDKKKSLIDAPIATALLTGIVAETDRFSNEHTTSKAMTVAASLMAAGADQQLIANELQAARSIEVKDLDKPEVSDSDAVIDAASEDGSLVIKKDEPEEEVESEEESSSDNLSIDHDGETLADLDRRIRGEEKAKEKVAEEVEAVQEEAAEDETDDTPIVEGISDVAVPDEAGDEPVLGGTLNATTEQAADDARREAESDQNKTILSHSYLGGNDVPPAAPGSENVSEALPTSESVHTAYALDDETTRNEPSTPESNGLGGERVIQPISEPAPNPVAPLDATSQTLPPLPPANPTPADLGLPLPPPLPDFSQLNGVGAAPAPAIPLPPTPPPAILGDILAPEPSVPDVSNAVAAPNTAYALEETPPVAVAPAAAEPSVDPAIPPLPPMTPDVAPSVSVPPLPEQPPQPANPADPGQFQIPGQ